MTTTLESQNKSRIVWIDCAKFLGFILVILGHVILIKGVWSDISRGIIYSFHMPFFFILSFMTMSLSKDFNNFLRKTKKRAIHLLIPFIIFLFIDVLFVIFYEHVQPNSFAFYKEYVIFKLLGLDGEGYIISGSAWFFIALFVGQSLFDLLHLLLKDDFRLFCVSLLLTLIGVIIGQRGIILPFELDMVFSSFIFFYIGYKLRIFNFNKYLSLGFVVSLLVFVGTFCLIYFSENSGYAYYEIWARRYPLFPISYICALSGSLTMMYLCVIICKIKNLGKFLGFFAKFNVYFIIVHSIHQKHFMYNEAIFPKMDYYLRNLIFCLIGAFICFLLIVMVKELKKVAKKQKNA